MAYLFTSEESVSEHPDKVADQISDALIVGSGFDHNRSCLQKLW